MDNHINPTNYEPFRIFLGKFSAQIRDIYREQFSHDRQNLQRGVPERLIREIMPLNPLSVCIPVNYGGRGGHVGEILAMLSAASYESLALSLTLGINSGLFLQPVTKYAPEETRKKIFRQFLTLPVMGGLMITEPEYGTDALNMQTSFTRAEGNFHVKGVKHWAGLTGFADYWLLTARERLESGELARDIDFFICDVHSAGQTIIVEEYFDNPGLVQIPYGRNLIDVRIPHICRLEPKTTGIKLLLDLLHRSRLHFPGMALGFIHRMMDEALDHCRIRRVSGHGLIEYDQVQHRLAVMQSSYTIASAMCAYSSHKAGLEHELSASGLVANSMKSLVTDLMQEAAQSLVQLVGAKAYRFSHIGGSGMADSRPFQIFEGSNDILYTQITENVVKRMKKAREQNLFQFLRLLRHTEKAVWQVKEMLNFNLNTTLSQRKMVELGKVLSRIIAMELVMDLGAKGYQPALVDNSLAVLRHDISGLMGRFRHHDHSRVVEDYQSDSSWMDFI
jgi:alkylation response protein AidB-like acyl-CoA dehydrogenase